MAEQRYCRQCGAPVGLYKQLCKECYYKNRKEENKRLYKLSTAPSIVKRRAKQGYVNCKFCGNVFFARKKNHIFCSAKCRERNKKGLKLMNKKCIVCGTIFETFNKKRRTCSKECSNIYSSWSRYNNNRLRYNDNREKQIISIQEYVDNIYNFRE